MLLIPDRYEDLNLSSNMKRIVSSFKKTLSDEYLIFLEVNPTAISTISFIILHKEEGLLCITVDENSVPAFQQYFEVMNPVIWSKQQELLLNKLRRERMLKGNGGLLKFNFNWVYFFVNEKKPMLTPSPINEFIESQCWFQSNFKDLIKSDVFIKRYFRNSLVKMDEGSKVLTDEEINNIGFVIAPHCYIPRSVAYFDAMGSTSEFNKDSMIVEADRTVKALSLDSQQINIVNNISQGDQLILACAGSGKSTILIAKAFKVASLYPEKKVLITCFNNNLAQFYRWQIDVAGFNDRNVECRTFHSLCQDLLIKNGLAVPFNNGSENYHEEVFQYVLRAMAENKIKTQYDAIFIDEVQIFKKDWYAFCYNLIRDKSTNGHLFVICGDKSQNVNDNVEKGLAPWQFEDDKYPDFRTNTLRIENNYRNSIEINEYINTFVTIVKKYFLKFSIEIEDSEDLFLRGKAIRPGEKPQVICSDRGTEVEEVFRIIDHLHENKKIPLTDIAILIPQRSYRNNNYYILNWLKDKMNERYMDYSLLLTSEDNYSRYGERNGVSICTIQSALGLDFRAVIICGLYPLGFYDRVTKVDDLTDKNIPIDEMNKRKQEFFKIINQIYTGATRARDHLHIVLTHGKENIYSKILLKANAEVNKNGNIKG